MSCCDKYKKSVLDAYSNTSRTYVTNDNIFYDNAYILNGESITYTANTATPKIVKSGLYLVMFSADAVATTAGDITMQLLRNNVAVPSAKATVTAANTTDTNNITLHTLIEVNNTCCCSGVGVNSIPVSIANTGVGVTVTNAKIDIIKLA
jgi:hypothetical protein